MTIARNDELNGSYLVDMGPVERLVRPWGLLGSQRKMIQQLFLKMNQWE